MRRLALLVVAVGIVAAAIALWLFPRALPLVALEQSLTRDVALARADSFFRAHALAPANARTAVRFRSNDSLRVFVELGGGGRDTLNALVRGDDVAPFAWSVRAFVPGDPREARVDFAPDGRVLGFDRRLAEADQRPEVSADSARRLAELALGTWLGERLDRWALVSTSFETKKASGRVDRTFTFERRDRRIAAAPIRAEAVVAGDTPSRVRRFVDIPESFNRRYAGMRSWNDLLALLASIGVLAIVIVGIVALARFARARSVRWREPMIVGVVIGALMFAAALNELPGSWFGYDTAMSPVTFQALQVLIAISVGVSTALLAGFTLAAAEAATRRAFPHQLDWWALWRQRGTREVAAQVGGGYAVAAIAFAYVAVFYLVTRSLFGWWVPSELLDDPNQIATPLPWISGIAISLNAGVWEEALFRALPLSLLSLWIGQRPGRRWWLAGGVVVTALVFGFAHANYASWPPYSRGVEIFLDACFWAVLFLQFGLLVTVVAHFLYDAVLFGIFAASGTAIEYRITAAIILVAILSPALVVLWRRLRQGAFTTAPADARFGAWTPAAEEAPAPAPVAPARAGFSARSRRLALGAAVLGLLLAIGRPPGDTLGPRFTAGRDDVLRTADSVLRARGGDPTAWRRLVALGSDTMDAWPRFVREHDIEADARRLATSYAPQAWWVVRYVRTRGSTAERAEEWRVRLWPDGRPLDARRLIPDSAARDTIDTDAARRLARASLSRAGTDTLLLREVDVKETSRPARRDVTVTYADTSVRLPAGASARAWVYLAGDEPLVARRGIELPEAFLRADRSRRTDRLMVAGVSIMLLIGFVVSGALFVKRRRPILLEDATLERRTTVLGVSALTLLMALSMANELPSQLFGWDTAQPWSTYLTGVALSFVATVVMALVVYGLLLVTNALRRRVGIPLVPDAPEGTRRDVLVAGLGLAGIAYASSALVALSEQADLPPPADTALDRLVPALMGVPDVAPNALSAVVGVAIPLLVIAGVSTKRAGRVALAALFVALISATAWSTDAGANVDPMWGTLALVASIATAVALVHWGGHAAAAWFVAALAFQGFDGLRDAVYGAVWEARVSGTLVLATAVACLWFLLRRVPTRLPTP